jgi:hypothetical protein
MMMKQKHKPNFRGEELGSFLSIKKVLISQIQDQIFLIKKQDIKTMNLIVDTRLPQLSLLQNLRAMKKALRKRKPLILSLI